MSDSSTLIENHIGLSSDLCYNLKPSCPRSRAVRLSLPSSNATTFQPSQTIIFNIPTGRLNSYLDPTSGYFKFTIKNNDSTATNFMCVDNVAQSFISRVDIFHAGNLLESIQEYGVLCSYLADFSYTNSMKTSLSNVYGFNGVLGSEPRQGSHIGLGLSQSFCIPLMCGLFNSTKYLPLGRLIDDIRIEITIQQNNLACCYQSAQAIGNFPPISAGWTVQLAELELTIIEMSDEGEHIIQSQSPRDQPLYIASNSFRHYVSTLTAGSSGGFSFLIPSRFSSLKSLIVLPRQSVTSTNINCYSISSRVNPNIQSYFFRVGSSIMPAKNVVLQSPSGQTASYSEAFMEVAKSFHALNNMGYISGMSSINYNVAETVDATNTLVTAASTGYSSYTNGFAIAIELETMNQRSDSIISGVSTLSSNVFFEGTITTTAPALAANYILDFYANFDVIFEFSPQGIITAKF